MSFSRRRPTGAIWRTIVDILEHIHELQDIKELFDALEDRFQYCPKSVSNSRSIDATFIYSFPLLPDRKSGDADRSDGRAGEFLNREEAVEELLSTGIKAFKTSGPRDEEDSGGFEDEGMMGHDEGTSSGVSRLADVASRRFGPDFGGPFRSLRCLRDSVHPLRCFRIPESKCHRSVRIPLNNA